MTLPTPGISREERGDIEVAAEVLGTGQKSGWEFGTELGQSQAAIGVTN